MSAAQRQLVGKVKISPLWVETESTLTGKHTMHVEIKG
ncbi:MAG: hypothetical protein ACI915_004035 [Gammaproteobacteria bacterium]|jgi:hypothetical protein